MGKYLNYIEKPREFLALTGSTKEEFAVLLPYFKHSFEERMKKYCLDGSLRRNRPYCEYKNSPLATIEEKLFFILHYLKSNNLQMVQGALFSISQPKANMWIHALEPALNEALAEMGHLPARKMDAVSFEVNDKLYFHDGTERPIRKPSDAETQIAFYSGKKTTYG